MSINVQEALTRFNSVESPPHLRPEFLQWYRGIGGIQVSTDARERLKGLEDKVRAIKKRGKGDAPEALLVLMASDPFTLIYRNRLVVGLWDIEVDRSAEDHLRNVVYRVKQEFNVPISRANPHQKAYGIGFEKHTVGGVRLPLLEFIWRNKTEGRTPQEIAQWLDDMKRDDSPENVRYNVYYLREELKTIGQGTLLQSCGRAPVRYSLASC